MTDKIIEDIKKKYIVKSSSGQSLPRATNNVQAQINKIIAIHKFVSNTAIGVTELNRLENAVNSLHKLIRNKCG